MADDFTREPTAAGDAPPDAKLTVKVGGNEVHLEARPEVVREELGRVLDRLFQAGGEASDPDDRAVVSVTAPLPAVPKPEPPPAQASAPAPSAIDAIARARGRQMLQPGAVSLLAHVTFDPERLNALYSADPTGQVYLLTPAGTADRLDNALLLLLYGALTVRGLAAVNGRYLLRGARSLGYKLTRVPREFARNGKLAAVHGRHRSKAYRLTADGVRHCEALIPGLLQIVDG